MYDLLLRGGTLYDGTGGPGRPGEVALAGGRIAALGGPGELRGAARTLEIPGLAVAPGFLDLHCHYDTALIADPAGEAALRQGVTLQLNGVCGISPFPLPAEDREAFRQVLPVLEVPVEWGWASAAEYLEALRGVQPGLNVATCVGHGTVRAKVAGFELREVVHVDGQERRPLREEELCRMEAEVAAALEQGAGGLSFGLVYPPGFWAPTEELVRMARVAEQYDRLVTIHIRGEDERLLGALAEAITIGEQSGAFIEIAHLKASGEASWGRMPEALALIEDAVERGVRVGFDFYPYTAGSTYLSSYLPAWVMEGGWEVAAERLRDPELRARLRDQLATSQHPDFGRLMISGIATEGNRNLVGQFVAAAAAERGQSLADFLAELFLAEDNRVMSICFFMCDEDMELALAHPLGVLGTDSLIAMGPGQAPHPRCFGSFPRVLGRYVREKRLLTLGEAVRKLSALPAERLGLADRGRLAEGCAGDVVVFDPATVMDTATYEDPRQYPIGIEYVLVNGQVAVEGGELTGVRAGEVL